MIIYNLKVNKNSILKFCLIAMAVIAIIIGVIAGYFLVHSVNKKEEFFNESNCIPDSNIAVVSPNDYSNILKEVHEDIDTYIGQKISFTGYVFKLDNFQENQFVLARDMDIGNNKTLIVGFLCESEIAKEFQEYSWVNITGEITKGYYNQSEIPILKIITIEQVEKPENSNVPLPNSEYVPTAIIY